MEMLLRDITVFTFDIPCIYIPALLFWAEQLLRINQAVVRPSEEKKRKSMKSGVVSQILHVKLEKVLLIIPIHVCIDIHQFNFVI